MSDIEVIAVSVTDTPSSPPAAPVVTAAATAEPSPAPKPSVWQKMRRSMVNDTKTALVLLLLGTNIITGYDFVHATMGDPRDYVQVNGSYGPLAYIPGEKPAAPNFGVQQSVFHAGDRVSFITNLCVAPGVTITGRAELVRTAQNGVPETVIDRRVTDVPPSMHRCGPRVGSFEFPADTLPGTYEIRRSVTVDGETSALRQWWPLKVQLEPLDLQVVTIIRTGPTDRTQDPGK